MQYAASALDLTGECSIQKTFFAASPVSVKLGAGPLLHAEFLETDALIADLLLRGSATAALRATGTALSLFAGAGYKHTLVYELIKHNNYLITGNAILSARLSQKLSDRGEIGVTVGTYSYFHYPRLIMPSLSLDTRWACSGQWSLAGELLLRFTSISAQENTQLEHADLRLGAMYAF